MILKSLLFMICRAFHSIQAAFPGGTLMRGAGVFLLLVVCMTGCKSKWADDTGPSELGEKQPLTLVSPGGGEFVEAFSRFAEWPRLVLIYSPT